MMHMKQSNKASSIWREASGKLGEILLRHYLAKEGIVSFDIAETSLPFDIIVPIPDGKIFRKKAIVQVKTETKIKKVTEKYGFYPSKESFNSMLKKIKELGYGDYEFWLALLWVNWKEKSLRFVGCLCPASDIKDEDFQRTKGQYLLFWKVRKKNSSLKFSSASAQEAS